MESFAKKNYIEVFKKELGINNISDKKGNDVYALSADTAEKLFGYTKKNRKNILTLMWVIKTLLFQDYFGFLNCIKILSNQDYSWCIKMYHQTTFIRSNIKFNRGYGPFLKILYM